MNHDCVRVCVHYKMNVMFVEKINLTLSFHEKRISRIKEYVPPSWLRHPPTTPGSNPEILRLDRCYTGLPIT